jgi:nitroimidazol reductase NimA-like FMN-containing flavoprotein (pyridoxamine 5'-phosphate oxidase superfamily)
MSQVMSSKEREAFLAEPRVGVIVVAGDGQPGLAVPMWYDYEPGGQVGFITSRHSKKAEAIRAASRLGLCVHCDEVPYRYVSVWGPVVEIRDTVTGAERRGLARRYLGPTQGDRYVDETAEATAQMIYIWMRPDTWLSQDQSR